MKTFKELMEEITAIKTLDSYDIERLYKGNKEDSPEQLEEKWRLKTQAYSDKEQKEIYRAILMHNAECAFWKEYVPVVLDCYNKYAGKRVGDKTREKIREAIRNALPEQINVYIDGDGIRYSIRNCSWKEMWYLWNKTEDKRYSMFDKEGKLVKFELEMFSFNKIYIEDIEGYIAEKVKQAEKIKQISKEYRELAHEYNENLCDGFKEADWSRTNDYFKFGF